jgi:pimeloyl-ACP methyl ester carboxylesterase
VKLWWEQSGEGPGVLIVHSYIQHPGVMQGLIDELTRSHRTVRYDARGSGQSTREGPYDMETDVEDLVAVAAAVAPLTAVLANGDATNRAVHAAARRPDLIPYVISMETVPMLPGQAEGTDALVASGGVLDALVGTMRADYRTGVSAAVQRGNPDMSDAEVRERVDATVAYTDHDASLARLEAWIADRPGGDPAALRDRLVVVYEGTGAWFTDEVIDRGRELLPEARYVKVEKGAISAPELTAAVVRSITGAAAPSNP